MIEQFKVLQNVKQLREDKALRALQTARAEVERAKARLRNAREAAEESGRTLPAREAQLYAEIMQRIVGLDDVDLVKERVLALMEDHQRMLDKVTRAQDHVKRSEDAAEKARTEYRAKQADTEKINTITAEMTAQAALAAVAAEETEIEDLFSGKTRPIGEAA